MPLPFATRLVRATLIAALLALGGNALVPDLLTSAAVAGAKKLKAESIEAFYGTWVGTWRRTDNSASGDATVNIRHGASTFANADFILNNGDLRFAQSPDFKDGTLQVRNGEAMKMDFQLISDGEMRIKYKRFGQKGEYRLTRKDGG